MEEGKGESMVETEAIMELRERRQRWFTRRRKEVTAGRVVTEELEGKNVNFEGE